MSADSSTWSQHPPWREIWRYTRHELLYLAWAGAEAALVGCLAVAFTPWARYWPIYQLGLLLFLLILIPFNLSRVFNLAHVSHGRQQLILIGLLLPVLFLALNQLLYEDTSLLGFRWLSAFYARLTQSGNPFWIRDVTVVIFVSLSWSRGIALIGREVDVDRLGLRLRVGALILAPILIALAGNQQAARVAPFVLLYMLSSLISVALTRAEEIEQGEARHGHSMTVRWFAVVAMASGVITLSAGIFAAATGRNALLFLRNWLGPIWLAIAFAATTTLAAITYVAQPLLALIDFVFAAIISLAQAIRALFPGSLAAQPPPTPPATWAATPSIAWSNGSPNPAARAILATCASFSSSSSSSSSLPPPSPSPTPWPAAASVPATMANSTWSRSWGRKEAGACVGFGAASVADSGNAPPPPFGASTSR